MSINLACAKGASPLRIKLIAHCLVTFITFLSLPHQSELHSGHVADLCDNGAVETAAHLVFLDGVEKYFLSNGAFYWFLNASQDIPDAQSALKIPDSFRPDAAILKDTRDCSGHLSLMLIQMKLNGDSSEAEWLTLEMKIGNWSDNETEPVFWGQVNKIARCDLEAKVCTTNDNYFATMSFDFKRKLNSAFGTIGKTAYFIQEQNMYKVIYKKQCIDNPYQEVIAYPAVSIGTTTTAALSIDNEQTLVFFDNDVNLVLTNITVEDGFIGDQLVDVAKWQENAHYFFKQCPLVESTFSFLLMDVFSTSKKHFVKKQIILIISALVLLIIIVLVLAVIVFNLLRKSKSKKIDQSSLTEANEEQLIERLNVEIKPGTENGEQQKTLLQTSC